MKNNLLVEKIPVVEYHNEVTNTPLVSVCVQTYQHVNYIKACLEGILMQKTNFDFEILLGEDESTDGTREICIEYARRFPDKIKLFLHCRENNIKINGRPTGRFNFLYNLAHAKGKYIALCEGDDYWTDPYKLQKQVNFLERNEEYSLCFHPAEVLSNDSKKIYLYKELEEREYNPREIVLNWLIPTCSVVFKRNTNYKMKYHKDILYGDILLFLTIAEFGRLWCMKDNMAVYRRHKDGVSNYNYNDLKGNKYNLKNRIRHFNALDDIFQRKYHQEIKYNISSAYLSYSIIISRRHFHPISILYLLISFINNPKVIFKKISFIYSTNYRK